jgi:hypothetical protein
MVQNRVISLAGLSLTVFREGNTPYLGRLADYLPVRGYGFAGRSTITASKQTGYYTYQVISNKVFTSCKIVHRVQCIT